MISIKPNLKETIECPYCSDVIQSKKVVWQGIHVCAEFWCSCRGEEKKFIADLSTGHAIYSSYVVDVDSEKLHGPSDRLDWFGRPLLESIIKPSNKNISFEVEILRSVDKIVVINCIDYLYGHSLLKLLNCQRHLIEDPEIGVVVLIQDFLRWMIPDGVSEIWTVGIKLSEAQDYYPLLGENIEEQCLRFSNVYLSNNQPHPNSYDISGFTGVKPFKWDGDDFRITFIWRCDRFWLRGKFLIKVLERIKVKIILEYLQALKIIILFRELKKSYPLAKFTIAGMGKTVKFPNWINDRRVLKYTKASEIEVCNVYAQSKLVIGVHGSSMLLPSGHSHTCLILMPKDRWGNFMQDILINEKSSLTALYKYKYVPLNSDINTVAEVARSCLSKISNAMPVKLAD